MHFPSWRRKWQPTPVPLLGKSHGQRSLVCYSLWGRKELDTTERPDFISIRMDCLDLLSVQGTLKNLLQHHSSKASILWPSAFFTIQLSHPYMTTGNTIALTRRTFVGKVMSLLFNMLSRLVIAFLPRSKCLNFTATVTICSDFGASTPQKYSFSLFPLFPYLFPMKWWDQMPWS